MHVAERPMKCSKCGAQNSETFHSQLRQGVLCLSCGHEKIIAETTIHPIRESTVWASTSDDDRTF